MSFYPGPMKAPSVPLVAPIPWPEPVTGLELAAVKMWNLSPHQPAVKMTPDAWAHIIRALSGAGYSIIRRADQ